MASSLFSLNAFSKRSVSASYKKTWVFKISAALFAISFWSPKARSRRTFTEGPPFMWERSSKANSVLISSTWCSFSIISFKNLAFFVAAGVVPGIVL